MASFHSLLPKALFKDPAIIDELDNPVFACRLWCLGDVVAKALAINNDRLTQKDDELVAILRSLKNANEPVQDDVQEFEATAAAVQAEVVVIREHNVTRSHQKIKDMLKNAAAPAAADPTPAEDEAAAPLAGEATAAAPQVEASSPSSNKKKTNKRTMSLTSVSDDSGEETSNKRARTTAESTKVSTRRSN